MEVEVNAEDGVKKVSDDEEIIEGKDSDYDDLDNERQVISHQEISSEGGEENMMENSVSNELVDLKVLAD